MRLSPGLKHVRQSSHIAVGWRVGRRLRPATHLTVEAQATLEAGIAGVGELGQKQVVVGSKAQRSAAGGHLFAYARCHGLPLLDLQGLVAAEAIPVSGEQLIALYHSAGVAVQLPTQLFVLSREQVHEVLAGLRRRAHEANAGPVTAAVWSAVLARYQRTCVGCGVGGKLTADHIVPVSRGGLSTEDNLQPLCQSCNSRKGDLTLDLRAAAAAWGRWVLQAQAAVGTYPLLELHQAAAAYVDAYLGLTKQGQGWAHAAWASADKGAARYSRTATASILQAVGLRQAALSLDRLWRLFTAGEASDNALAEALAVELRKWLATTGLRRLAGARTMNERGPPRAGSHQWLV